MGTGLWKYIIMILLYCFGEPRFRNWGTLKHPVGSRINGDNHRSLTSLWEGDIIGISFHCNWNIIFGGIPALYLNRREFLIIVNLTIATSVKHRLIVRELFTLSPSSITNLQCEVKNTTSCAYDSNIRQVFDRRLFDKIPSTILEDLIFSLHIEDWWYYLEKESKVPQLSADA